MTNEAPGSGRTLMRVGLLLLIAGGTCMAVGMIAATRYYALLVTEADTTVADSMGRLPGMVWFLAAGDSIGTHRGCHHQVCLRARERPARPVDGRLPAPCGGTCSCRIRQSGPAEHMAEVAAVCMAVPVLFAGASLAGMHAWIALRLFDLCSAAERRVFHRAMNAQTGIPPEWRDAQPYGPETLAAYRRFLQASNLVSSQPGGYGLDIEIKPALDKYLRTGRDSADLASSASRCLEVQRPSMEAALALVRMPDFSADIDSYPPPVGGSDAGTIGHYMVTVLPFTTMTSDDQLPTR